MQSFDLCNSVVTGNRDIFSSHYIQYNMLTAIDDSLMQVSKKQNTVHDRLTYLYKSIFLPRNLVGLFVPVNTFVYPDICVYYDPQHKW